MILEPDPLTLGSTWRSLRAAANEAGRTLQRTAYSEAVREGRDFSVALFDRDGRMVAQGDFSPGHLGSMPETVTHALGAYPKETLAPGDAVLFNDPWLGSGHLPDFLLTSPIFLQDELIGFIVSCAHMIDVGGAVSGSQAVSGISSVYQEGLRLPPIRVWQRGVPHEETLRVIEANVRVPDKVIGDLLAMRACNVVGGRAVKDIVGRVGLHTYRQVCELIIDHSEQAMRESIGRLPDGAYQAEDRLDDCGPDTGPIKIAVTVTVNGDELMIDFTGSDPQTRSGLNAVANYSKAYCYFVVKALAHGPDFPQNAGSLAPIKWHAPPGTVMNATAPSGVGARAIMQQRIVDVLMTAFTQVMPQRVVAPSSHWGNPVLGGVDPRTGRPFVLYDVIVGGWGGRFGRDGVEAMSASFNIDSIPTEVNEHSYPVLIERYELIRDSSGAGRWRGGHGVRKDVRMMTDDIVLANLGERHAFAPPGLLGGMAGAPAATVLNPDSDARKLHSKGQYHLRLGDVVSYRLAGGGGYGDPRDRDVELVAADVRNGLLSRELAETTYGVVLADDCTVDRRATDARRGHGDDRCPPK